MNLDLIKLAHAQVSGETETVAVQQQEHQTKAEGISLDPLDIALHALNFLVLLLILKWILYKPLVKILQEREQKVKQGVEDAEKAGILLRESVTTREKMLKDARAEGQSMVDAARKSGEEVRSELIGKAQDEAQHIVVAGKQAVDSERSKALLEIRTQAVDMVLMATEKLLGEKMDVNKDTKLINEALQTYVK